MTKSYKISSYVTICIVMFSAMLLTGRSDAGGGSGGFAATTPPPAPCNIRLNPSLVGTEGTSGPCEGLLIVDNELIKKPSSLANEGDGTFTFNPNEYNLDIDRTYSYTQIYTGNVTRINGLFRASPFNQDIGDWDVSSVTDMTGVFSNNQVFNQDLSKWDVSSVTTMNSMFAFADAFDQDIGDWDVSSVTDMGGMFYRNYKFNHDLSDWTVCQVSEYESFASPQPIGPHPSYLPRFGEDCTSSDGSNGSVSPLSGLSAEPSVNATSIDQSLDASALASILNQHADFASDAAPDLGEDRDVRDSPLDWYTIGFRQSHSSEVLAGKGTFVYGMIGNQIRQTDTQTFGYALGIEQGDWTYSEESDIVKTGFSVAAYGGRMIGTNTLKGSAMLTTFVNTHINEDGNEAASASNRLMLSATLNGNHKMARGASLSPYAQIMYAAETIGSYSYGGSEDTHGGTSAGVGTISLGLQYTTAPMEGLGIYYIRGGVETGFGTDTIILPNSDEAYTPHSSPTGKINLGWTSNAKGNTQATVDLTIGQIGNKDREEVKLNGSVNRKF